MRLFAKMQPKRIGPAALYLAMACLVAGQLFLNPTAVRADGLAEWLETYQPPVSGEPLAPPVPMAASEPTASGSSSTAANARRKASSKANYLRVARIPNMLGDSLPPTAKLTIQPTAPPFSSTDLPLAGGSRRMKIAENQHALPTDRVYFLYNSFQDALATDTDIQTPAGNSLRDIQRFTLGVEKIIDDDSNTSLDLRLPITDAFAFQQAPNSLTGGRLGNLSITLKRLLTASDDWALATGLSLDVPTGSHVRGTIQGVPIEFENSGLHLLPYLMLTGSPNDEWFFQTYLQVDVAASGNRILAGVNRTPLGVWTDQTLLYADLQVGKWLVQDYGAAYFDGVALIGEVHCTTALQDGDVVRSFVGNGITADVASAVNRITVVNATTGLHFRLTELSNLRLACSVPITTGPQRFYSSEWQMSFNRYW